MGSTPEGQHHLCEHGADDKHEISVPHALVAPVFMGDEKSDHEWGSLNAIRTPEVRRKLYPHYQQTFDVIFGWTELTFVKFGVKATVGWTYDGQHAPRIQTARLNTNMQFAKTDTSSESIYSGVFGQRGERSHTRQMMLTATKSQNAARRSTGGKIDLKRCTHLKICSQTRHIRSSMERGLSGEP